MSRIRTALVGVVAASLMLMSANAASADAPTVQTSVERQVVDLGNGWKINSPTTVTTTTEVSQQVQTRTVAGDYKAQIQQPINPDGTSTWPAKRGVIPVQFKLTKADKTEQRIDTVTKTTTAKTPSFQSVCGPNDTAWSVLGLYNIPAGTKVKDITKLQSDFGWDQGSSKGGSLRWDIGTNLGDIHVYYGASHSWTGTSGSGVNLMDATDDRFDDSNTSMAGGTFYNTKQQILDKWADQPVNNASMVVESCWTGEDQKVNITNATVGIKDVDNTINNPLAERVEPPTQAVSEGPWTVTGTSNPVQTNEAPAQIRVEKINTDPTPVDVIEPLSSAQGDTSGSFRQIDGKYMYNLKAETLGKGNFKVFMVIDGTRVETAPGVFELR